MRYRSKNLCLSSSQCWLLRYCLTVIAVTTKIMFSGLSSKFFLLSFSNFLQLLFFALFMKHTHLTAVKHINFTIRSLSPLVNILIGREALKLYEFTETNQRLRSIQISISLFKPFEELKIFQLLVDVNSFIMSSVIL